MAVKHVKLVVGYVLTTLAVTITLLRKQPPSSLPHPATHSHHAVLLNAVIACAAVCLLFSSTAFSMAAALLINRLPPKSRLHYSDKQPEAELRAEERRLTAVHTLVAANLCVAALWIAFASSLSSLRWALPPLPPWVTTCAAVLCAVNLASGVVLAAKHSRWAPWLLPSYSPVPLNEPCRLVAMFEQLRARCFGRRPGLPKAQKCNGRRTRMRRSASWDSLSPSKSACEPGCQQLCFSPLPLSPCTLPSNLEVLVASTAPEASDSPPSASPPSAGSTELVAAGSGASGAWADVDEASFQTPPRCILRTYSEDEEVSLPAGSASSATSLDADCSRVFMDVLQANIMQHPDDTLQFLQKLSPERAQLASPTPRLTLPEHIMAAKSIAVAVQQQQSSGFPVSPATPEPITPEQPAAQSLPLSQEPLSPLTFTPAVLPPPAATFTERKQQMTRVSATVDELLGAIVGELV